MLRKIVARLLVAVIVSCGAITVIVWRTSNPEVSRQPPPSPIEKLRIQKDDEESKRKDNKPQKPSSDRNLLTLIA